MAGEFKLSDHRGKVVVLTFSGNWCGPCREMYPRERALLARLKDRPFAILSVNTDPDRETLRKSIREGEITWRCWFDGGRDGPITSRWNVRSFPTVYVIDAEGVIREVGLRGDDLDRAVERLLGEAGRVPIRECEAGLMGTRLWRDRLLGLGMCRPVARSRARGGTPRERPGGVPGDATAGHATARPWRRLRAPPRAREGGSRGGDMPEELRCFSGDPLVKRTTVSLQDVAKRQMIVHAVIPKRREA